MFEPILRIAAVPPILRRAKIEGILRRQAARKGAVRGQRPSGHTIVGPPRLTPPLVGASSAGVRSRRRGRPAQILVRAGLPSLQRIGEFGVADARFKGIRIFSYGLVEHLVI